MAGISRAVTESYGKYRQREEGSLIIWDHLIFGLKK